MKNSSYIGLIIILIFFGFLFIPKIIDRLVNNSQVESNRSVPGKPLAYIKLNGEAKKVPDFLMLNQDSLFIGNEDFKEKVYDEAKIMVEEHNYHCLGKSVYAFLTSFGIINLVLSIYFGNFSS